MRITPAISIHRLYLVQSVGSGKVPSLTPHWKGAAVVGSASVIDVVGLVAVSVVVVSAVVAGSVDGQFPMTHNFLTGSKYAPEGQVY